MRQHLLFVLLLAPVLALSQNKPDAQPAAGAVQARVKTKAVQGRTEHAQAKTEKAQKSTEQEQATAQKTQTLAEAQASAETTPTQAEETQTTTGADGKLVSVPGGKALGMSVLGNQEAPKSLVIVPWKTSELGRSPGLVPMLDESRQPVDKEVFMRALHYYEIRSGTKPQDSRP